MKALSSTVGLDLLLKKISRYSESEPGKAAILNLNPNISKEKRLLEFKRLSEIKTIKDYLPNLYILRKAKLPERGKPLEGKKILYYSKLLGLSEEIKNTLIDNSALKEFSDSLNPVTSLKEEINKFVEENGTIKTDSTPKLKKLYNEKISVEDKIERKLKKTLREKSSLLQDNIITTRLGRTVLPVKYERKNQIEGIIVDFSRSQNTAFIEPGEIVTYNNKLSEIEKEINEETKRILKHLTNRIKQNFSAIERNTDILARIDSLKARTKYAENFDCIIPDFTEQSNLRLKKCYHPLLLEEKRAVEPLDLEIGKQERILLVSGPNAGGKTVLLKTIGINTLSAFAGIPIPAQEGSTIGSFANIAGIIEDEQSMEENLSTFSSYIVRLKEVLKLAGEKSLILLDELGGNTDPGEGNALSIALLNTFKDKKSLVIATTHLSPLKFYVENQKGMINGAMQYENGPTYHLAIGTPGGSRTIATAQKLGLPEKIIDNAKSFLNSEVFEAEKLIEELSARNKKLQALEEEKRRLKKKASKLKEKYEKELNNIEAKRNKTIKEAKEKAKNILAESRSTVEKTIKEIKESKASKESIKKYKNTFKEITQRKKKQKEKPITSSPKKTKINYDIDLNIPLEISVRGMTQPEAWKAADKFLDKAVLANYDSVRILHGKGSWILRNMLHNKLKEDPRVKNIETPPHYEGGKGVTIAVLK